MTKDPQIATVGTNAPDMDSGEGTLGKEPLDPPNVPTVAPAFSRGRKLDQHDRSSLRRAVEHLADIVNDIGIGTTTVQMFGVERESVLEMYPDAAIVDYAASPDCHAFTRISIALAETGVDFFVNRLPDVGPDAIEGVAP